MPALQEAPVVKVNGRPLGEAQLNSLTSVEVDRGVNLVGRATLRFIESGYDLSVEPLFALGTPVEVSVNDGPTLFKGEVTGINLDQSPHGPFTTELSVIVDDKAHKLGRDTQNRAFLNQKYSEVLSSIAGEAGLSADVTAFGDVQEYLLQSGTSLAYLDWVASRFGLLWWVDADQLKVKEAGESVGTVDLTLGRTLRRLSTRASGLHTGKVTVTGWDVQQQVAIKDVAETPISPEADLFAKVPGRVRATGAGVALASTSLTAAEAKVVSTGVLARSAAAAVTARGTCEITPGLKPGVKVSIQSAGSASGTYFVSRVQHVYTPSGFDTHFTAGPLQPEALVDLLGAPPAPVGGSIGGLVPAIITDIQDEKNWGRVKVKFPTLGTTGGVESAWARVLTLGGGGKRGVVFHPEINDEVLVGFEGGDTRRPVVLGGLYSAKNTLPSSDNVADGKTAYRRITSRVGHIVELADGDSPEKKHVLLKTANGHQIRVGEDEMTLEVANKPIKITNGGATITLKDGKLILEGTEVTIKASATLKLEGQAGVEIKTGATAKVEGAIVNVKAQASGTVEAGAMLALKGGIVAIN